MKSAAIAVLLAVSAGGLVRPAGPSVYTDGTYGFRIEAPAFPRPKGGSVAPVMFFAPAADAFADNVNVSLQYTDMGVEAYRDLTLRQFKENGLTVNAVEGRKVSGRDALLFDYSGRQMNRDLRWLALAVVEKERVFLITCTALKGSFESREKAFRACLDSFAVAD
jgi:hypothetical protein